MFFTQYWLRMKSFAVERSTFFWTSIFPFLLATLFYFAFGKDLIADTMEPIPTAVVYENDAASGFDTLLQTLGNESSNPILDIRETTSEEAAQLLEEDTIKGIITISDIPRLTVRSSGTSQNILKVILDTWLRKSAIFEEIATSNPSALPALADTLTQEISYVTATSLGSRTLSPVLQFFYALIAMSCMYTAFYGLVMATDLQGNLSALAARRTLSPAKRWRMMLSDYLAILTLSILVLILLFAYLLLLGVDFGDQLGLTLLTGIIGCILGLSLGTFIGCVTRKSLDFKIGIHIGVSMFCCFCAGLMSNYIPAFLEQHLPFVNRINPAQLIANSFYCLTFYDDHKRYAANMLTLLLMSLALGIASILLMRRKKYASI